MLISGDISFDIDIDIKLISRALSIFGRLSLSLIYQCHWMAPHSLCKLFD